MQMAPPGDALSESPHSTPGDLSTRSIMLRTSQDERAKRINPMGYPVFLGSTAAISFLEFLQQTWRTYVEPNSFTENPGTKRMLEADIPRSLTPPKEVLDDSQKRRLVGSYLHASSGILDLFTENDVERILACSNPQVQCPPSPEDTVDPEVNQHVLLDLMIAIGAQAAAAQHELCLAVPYFTRAQRAAFAGMLQAPTVDLARAFVLMAFYMLGACNRNAALMYIGVASNMSMILGLHLPEKYQHLPIEKREARLQTCKSIRVLDLICNTILGRPGNTPIICDEREFLDGEICPNYATLCATYEVVSVLQSVVNKTTENEGIHIDDAEEFIQQLQKWSGNLPAHLRQQSLASHLELPTLATNRAIIGKIHLACIYYYAVIQVTRQFLVSQIIPHIRGQKVPDSVNERETELATMCTEAALLMIQMCEDAAQANSLLGNMCILK
ncbi:predicted protein [Aspergillus terreus NIH2624]|uniref:Xylanolytic transcriptional activator regulatory domain-containing protein n=1 Tax=Aspergillus terreus (strain NIH 2624 / FGSC A1156) TaxID=341663 RepID=Q0CBP5_ASPTN|nr:uncharacterized protein ATEG_08889 [Aspergillus terreus NIH2624]EAU31021.1 predicted protein [Aspergillus terreus NIH2624]